MTSVAKHFLALSPSSRSTAAPVCQTKVSGCYRSGSLAKCQNKSKLQPRQASYLGNNVRNFQQTPSSFRPLRAPRRCFLVRAELELTEENVEACLIEARDVLGQLFDESVGMTGTVTLAELDGPIVMLRLQGRFWHERSLVLARVGHFLQQKIPEILEVEIEDEAQLDDSPENF